jgi:translation initiation factor IF-3
MPKLKTNRAASKRFRKTAKGFKSYSSGRRHNLGHKDSKRKQKQIQVKEVKFRPGTEEGDYQVKLRNLIRFLTEGDKAKVTLRFRGREMAHQDIGRKLLARVSTDLATHAVVEQNPLMEGRQMVMVFSPKKK